jgi:hypothetical protein
MTSTSGNGKQRPSSIDRRHPPAGFVEVATYDLLVDAGEVIGPLADEMPVWCQCRPVWLESGAPPTDAEDVRIWVPEAKAERARQLLAKLVPLPPTQEDFERKEGLSPSEPRGASAVRWLLVTLLALGAFVSGMMGLQRCGG